MEKPTFDPGLTQQYTGVLKRAINRTGEFNVRRTGVTWRDSNPYLFLISAHWSTFLVIVFVAFLVVNMIFAGVYLVIGIDHLKGADMSSPRAIFASAFFFSAHTLTTVGYGNIFPTGTTANSISAFEALVGLMGFALATGLFFGRFSRPSARIAFSSTIIVAPYLDGTSLQFRIVNRRSNNLIDLEATLMLMTVELMGDRLQRKYVYLELERKNVLFFPLTWTVVHPIDQNSPFYGKTPEDLARLQAEVLIRIKGFDDTFGQTVHARYSYRYDEITWGARFTPAFEIDKDGDLHLEVDKVSETEPAPLRPVLT